MLFTVAYLKRVTGKPSLSIGRAITANKSLPTIMIKTSMHLQKKTPQD